MTTNASRDLNRKPTVIGVSDLDGVTILRLYVDPSHHSIIPSDGTSGTDYGTVDAQRDLDHDACWMGTSSADGKTPVAIYFDNTNNGLKTKST
jgi:hypothetical protein